MTDLGGCMSGYQFLLELIDKVREIQEQLAEDIGQSMRAILEISRAMELKSQHPTVLRAKQALKEQNPTELQIITQDLVSIIEQQDNQLIELSDCIRQEAIQGVASLQLDDLSRHTLVRTAQLCRSLSVLYIQARAGQTEDLQSSENTIVEHAQKNSFGICVGTKRNPEPPVELF